MNNPFFGAMGGGNGFMQMVQQPQERRALFVRLSRGYARVLIYSHYGHFIRFGIPYQRVPLLLQGQPMPRLLLARDADIQCRFYQSLSHQCRYHRIPLQNP